VHTLGFCAKTSDVCNNKNAVLSHRKPRDAAVNFNTYRNLKQHRAISLPWNGCHIKQIGKITAKSRYLMSSRRLTSSCISLLCICYAQSVKLPISRNGQL